MLTRAVNSDCPDHRWLSQHRELLNVLRRLRNAVPLLPLPSNHQGVACWSPDHPDRS